MSVKKKVRYRALSREEADVILFQKTEPPGSGKYTSQVAPGLYLCRQCDASLYLSHQKFESPCGWPSFDDAVDGAIGQRLDPDGRRVEIFCKRCEGHLGHLFEGEGLTPKNLRHCVNSRSLSFTPHLVTGSLERALFAAGCFWEVEEWFRSIPGVVSTAVGYMGGTLSNPTYEEVALGDTGHAESVEVIFNPQKITYRKLVELFLTFPHVNPQIEGWATSPYRSEIFYLTEGQREIATGALQKENQKETPQSIGVHPASHFYRAEAIHQGYLKRCRMEDEGL